MTQSIRASHLRLVPDQAEEAADQAIQLTDEAIEEELLKNSNFARISIEEALKLAKLTKEKTIHSCDILVIFAMMSMTDWRDGKCRATNQGLADALSWDVTQVSRSMMRLKKAFIIVPVKEQKTKQKVHLFNPRLLIYGTGKRRGYLIKKYAEAIHANLPFTVTV
jgi:histone H3/H4